MQLSKEFKIRCSGIGIIMSNPRSKKDIENGVLSKTAQSYCDNWIKEQLYNRKKEFTSKYTDKGHEVEEASIKFAADQLNWGMVFKNDEYKEDDYKTGTCDLNRHDTITDLKNSWDWSTFPLFETSPPDANNEWQIQGYMDLYGKKKGEIVYVLSDTPEHLVDREISKASYNRLDGELSEEDVKGIIQNHRYDDISANLKIKVFSFEYDQKKIDAIHKRVEECRNYIDERIKSLTWI